MDAKEGIRRIVKTLSAVAWVCLALGILSGLASRSDGWPVFFFGAIAFMVLQGIAWITAGFASNNGERDGLIRPRDLMFWRRTGPASGDNTGPIGVGGWLYFPIFALFVGPFISMGELMSGFAQTEAQYPAIRGISAWSNYKMTCWAIVIASAFIGIRAGRLLWVKHRPESVHAAIIAFWVLGPIGIAAIIVAQLIFLKVTLFQIFDARTLGSTVGASLGSLFWVAYLKWSRRVRNTYFHQLYSAPSPAPVEREEPTL